MRILYITNGFPYPLTSGYLRHYHLIRGLSEHHAVTLLSLVGRSFRREHAEALAPFTTRVTTFGEPEALPRRMRQAMRLVRAVMPGGAADQPVRRMRAAVQRILHDDPPDAIVFSGKRTYPAIAGVRGVPLIADMCDATSVRIRGRMRHSGPAERLGLWMEYLQVRAVERRLVRQAHHLLFASPRDCEAIVGPAGHRVSVVPNGVELGYWQRQSDRLGEDTIVMTGAMDYAPNCDAALYLTEEILPRVRRSVPEATLLIVGRDPPLRLIETGRRHGACVTGSVPDVRPYLERASVFVAPIRFGAGIQNKLLEAMAMGVPVVASPVAAEGLRTAAGDEPPLGVARNTEGFVAEILRRLAETRRNQTPDGRARQFVEQHFVWSRSTSQLDEVIRTVAIRRPA